MKGRQNTQRTTKKNWYPLVLLGVTMALTLTLIHPKRAEARRGFSIGATGMGNFFLTDSNPNLSIGPGGGLFFDYRFNQRWAIETDLFVTTHDGREVSTGDDGILLLGVPTVELKFYLRGQENKIDPYLSAGVGIFVLTEGNIDNNTGGVGMGGIFGLGADFYVLERLSLGLAAKFRPIAIIQGNSQSAGLINFAMIGNIAFHFGKTNDY